MEITTFVLILIAAIIGGVLIIPILASLTFAATKLFMFRFLVVRKIFEVTTDKLDNIDKEKDAEEVENFVITIYMFINIVIIFVFAILIKNLYFTELTFIFLIIMSIYFLIKFKKFNSAILLSIVSLFLISYISGLVNAASKTSYLIIETKTVDGKYDTKNIKRLVVINSYKEKYIVAPIETNIITPSFRLYEIDKDNQDLVQLNFRHTGALKTKLYEDSEKVYTPMFMHHFLQE